jgi:hypothetical protein
MVVNQTEAAGICVVIVGSFYSIVLLFRALLRRASRSTRSTAVKSDPGAIISEYRKSIEAGSVPAKECDFTILLSIVVWLVSCCWSFVFYRYL